LGLKCVDGWEPNYGSPGEVETKVIMANIDGAKIPIFVDKEIHHVDGVEDGRHHY
jgi:hypothetical protein